MEVKMITIESEIPRFRSVELDSDGEDAGKLKAVLEYLGISYKVTYALDSYGKGTLEYFASDDVNQVIRDALRGK
jgi:hypothetical protein